MFSCELEIFSWGSSKGLFLIFVLDTIVMYFVHFEDFQMKWVLFFIKFLFCKVCWSCLSYLLFWLPTLEMSKSYLLLSIYFSLKKVVGYLLNYFPHILEWLFVTKHQQIWGFKFVLISIKYKKHLGIHWVGLTI